MFEQEEDANILPAIDTVLQNPLGIPRVRVFRRVTDPNSKEQFVEIQDENTECLTDKARELFMNSEHAARVSIPFSTYQSNKQSNAQGYTGLSQVVVKTEPVDTTAENLLDGQLNMDYSQILEPQVDTNFAFSQQFSKNLDGSYAFDFRRMKVTSSGIYQPVVQSNPNFGLPTRVLAQSRIKQPVVVKTEAIDNEPTTSGNYWVPNGNKAVINNATCPPVIKQEMEEPVQKKKPSKRKVDKNKPTSSILDPQSISLFALSPNPHADDSNLMNSDTLPDLDYESDDDTSSRKQKTRKSSENKPKPTDVDPVTGLTYNTLTKRELASRYQKLLTENGVSCRVKHVASLTTLQVGALLNRSYQHLNAINVSDTVLNAFYGSREDSAKERLRKIKEQKEEDAFFTKMEEKLQKVCATQYILEATGGQVLDDNYEGRADGLDKLYDDEAFSFFETDEHYFAADYWLKNMEQFLVQKQFGVENYLSKLNEIKNYEFADNINEPSEEQCARCRPIKILHPPKHVKCDSELMSTRCNIFNQMDFASSSTESQMERCLEWLALQFEENKETFKDPKEKKIKHEEEEEEKVISLKARFSFSHDGTVSMVSGFDDILP